LKIKDRVRRCELKGLGQKQGEAGDLFMLNKNSPTKKGKKKVVDPDGSDDDAMPIDDFNKASESKGFSP
jgi:hypothetical protein